jgi:Maltokinase N-terminal cap domain
MAGPLTLIRTPADTGSTPELTKAGEFRLDDPAGAVGIEFMVVSDGSGDRATTYQVPLMYRASARDGADDALIGTAEHGVLGRRWIYDGTHDPVLRINRVLTSDDGISRPGGARQAGVAGSWLRPNRTPVHGIFASAHRAHAHTSPRRTNRFPIWEIRRYAAIKHDGRSGLPAFARAACGKRSTDRSDSDIRRQRRYLQGRQPAALLRRDRGTRCRRSRPPPPGLC